MKKIDATKYDHKTLNCKIREAGEGCELVGTLGQRFIAAGMDAKKIRIDGTPGNALGAYLNGAQICVYGNAQDAVGDTMNDGEIIIHGNIGDAAGYAMRGGEIFVKGNAGYRAGSFLGEYQAGGVIIVLGLTEDERKIVSNFPCTGMHGGKMFLRSDCSGIRFPGNVTAAPATEEDLGEIKECVSRFCRIFGYDENEIWNSPFTKIVPDSKNPYKQMYVAN